MISMTLPTFGDFLCFFEQLWAVYFGEIRLKNEILGGWRTKRCIVRGFQPFGKKSLFCSLFAVSPQAACA
jgi:hypothetical protein